MADKILGLVINAIRENWLPEENLAALKAELRSQIEQPKREATEDQELRRRLKEIDADIERAGSRLARASYAVFDILTGEIEKLRADRDAIERQIRESVTQDGSKSTSRIVDEAIEQLWALRQCITGEPDAEIAQRLSKIVERVELVYDHHTTEKTTQSKLKRGIIHLRGSERVGAMIRSCANSNQPALGKDRK